METWLWALEMNWPVVVLCAFLIAGACIDCWELRVPNWLTFGMMASGLILGTMWDGWQGLWASLVLLGLGFLLLWPLYAIGGMGAGDVKMQMGFGAWIGALYGLTEGVWIVVYGFCLAAVVGGALAVVLMIWHGRWRDYRSHTAEILTDLASGGNLESISQRAAQRKPRMVLLPYGLPLCIGFIGYLLLRLWMQSG
ncbi:MAG: A24 family peptidase [Gemmatales bacterium]|nr:A24 family peptidase [Gemmatales bacterium]